MEEKVYEEKPRVDAKTLEEIFAEQEKEKQQQKINKKPPLAKTLLEMYGSDTPTSEVLNFIARHKTSIQHHILGLGLLIGCLIPMMLFEYLFETLGILLFFAFVAIGIYFIVKGKIEVKDLNNTLENLSMTFDDYEMVSDEYERFNKQSVPTTIAGILLIVFSIAPMIFVDEVLWRSSIWYILENLGFATGNIMLLTGICLMVYNSLNKKLFKKMLNAHNRNKRG